MKVLALCLIALLAAGPAFAEDTPGRGKLFWSGLALGVAGVTTSVLGVTVYRVEDSSSGNAPPSAFRGVWRRSAIRSTRAATATP